MLTVEPTSDVLSPLLHWYTHKLQHQDVQTNTVFNDGHCLVCIMYSNYVFAMQLQDQLPLLLQQRTLVSDCDRLVSFIDPGKLP